MASSNKLPGDFVLEVADLGGEVVASFTKLISSRKIQEKRLENILATLSITTSILTDLGTTINKYEKESYIEDEVTRPTCQTCKADLEKLLVISKEAGERGIWVREGTLGGKPVSAEIDPWFLFNVGLGGQVQSADFFQRLDSTRYSLVALTDTVKYKIFKTLKEMGQIDLEQAEELKSLSALLPQLVKTIERAEKAKKDQVAWDAERSEKPLKSSRNRPRVEEKDETVAPPVRRKSSDAASELTMIGSFQEDLRKKKNVQFAENYRRRSTDSVDTLDSEFLDTKEVLEEWRLRWAEPKRYVRQSVEFLGLKVKSYDEDPGYWGIDPELRSQSELQNALHILTSNTSPANSRASVKKAMRALPEQARECVEGLIELRTQNTSNGCFKRQWSVVAVQPKIKNHFGGDSWFKSVKSQDWLIMIKGETLDRTERKRPDRWDDPWRKPHRPAPRRRRYPGVIEDEYANMDYRRRSLPAPVRALSPTTLLEDNRHRLLSRDAEVDGFKPGTIVVGDILSHDDAERKMDEILTDLPGKFAA